MDCHYSIINGIVVVDYNDIRFAENCKSHNQKQRQKDVEEINKMYEDMKTLVLTSIKVIK